MNVPRDPDHGLEPDSLPPPETRAECIAEYAEGCDGELYRRRDAED